MFRRKDPAATAPAASSATSASSGDPGSSGDVKGRPTPSRKEAEAARKARLQGTTDKKARTKADRADQRAEREKARAAMMAGDPRFLPVRDQGEVRQFARDFVDSRRSLGEFMLPAVVVFLFLSFIPSTAVRGWAILGFYVFMLVLIADTAFLGWRVKRRAATRYPDGEVKGVGLYSAMRAIQLRRLRAPRPRVPVGAPVG